jgi:hypothetical protein
LSYRPARLHRLMAGRYDNPMPELTKYPPVRDYEFCYRKIGGRESCPFPVLAVMIKLFHQ